MPVRTTKSVGYSLVYDTWSIPLTVEQIDTDINHVRSVRDDMYGPPANEVVDEILMWQFQWNWLVECSQPICETSRALDIGAGEWLATHRVRKNKTVFGIPVRICD
jgi:hypothetical protein